MTDTDAHDAVLARRNVLAVYEDQQGTLTAAVSQKLPGEDLADVDLVSQAVPDRDTDVVDAGLDEDKDAFDPLLLDPDDPISAYSDRHRRHRPVEAGVSEINAQSTAATAGPWPVQVTDTSAAKWSPDVSEGDLVRVSNSHVYARSGQADFGEPILQPSPADGGGPSDKSGELAGYVALADDITADAAARTSTAEEEAVAHELPHSWPTGVIRGDYTELVGEILKKTGRTTGVKEGALRGTGASVRVRYPDPVGVVTLRDQLVTADISDGGDSGAPVFTGDGEFVGIVAAGSPRISVVSSAGSIESELGVRILSSIPDAPDDTGDSSEETTDRDTTGEDDPSLRTITRRILADVFGAAALDETHRTTTGRMPDFHVTPDDGGPIAVEVLESDDDYPAGLGQSFLYGNEGGTERAVLVVRSPTDIDDVGKISPPRNVSVVSLASLKLHFTEDEGAA